MIDEKIKNIIRLANKYPVINRVGVFGSYARGEQTADSDIDILYHEDLNNKDSVLEVLNYGAELTNEFEKLNIECDYVSYWGIADSPNKKTRNRILSEVVWLYER